MHSTVCDLAIDDLWSSFREELTSGIKRLWHGSHLGKVFIFAG